LPPIESDKTRKELIVKSIEQMHTYARHLHDSRERWWLALIVANGVAAGWLTANKFTVPMWPDVEVSSIMLSFNLLAFVVIAWKTPQQLVKTKADITALLRQIDPKLPKDPGLLTGFPAAAYSRALRFIATAFALASVAWIFSIAEAIWSRRG
jgi:hypothetical protein